MAIGPRRPSFYVAVLAIGFVLGGFLSALLDRFLWQGPAKDFFTLVTFGSDRGAFLYQHRDVPFNRNSFALTAAGLTTIYQAGLYSDREVERFCKRKDINTTPRISDCLQYLARSYNHVWRDYRRHYFYFYGNYYAIQALYTRGGREWRDWYSMVRDDLLHLGKESQGPDGQKRMRWTAVYVGDAFATAVAAIILQVPTHYLPIFQR